MITDLELAQACADIYQDEGQWDNRFDVAGIIAGRRVRGDAEMIVFRGSQTMDDWLRDFSAVIVDAPYLGHVHEGFYKGVPDVVQALLPVIGPNVYVTGHSLGAAHAPLVGAVLAAMGKTPRGIVMFAPPRPGLIDFREKLILSGTILRAYHNHLDPVPDVPIFPFVPVVEPIMFDEPGAADDDEPLSRHHVALYVKGVQAIMNQAPTS